MNKKQQTDTLMGNQGVKTPCFEHPCCICGQPDAPFGYGVFLRQGIKGLWYCAEHKAAGDAGCGMQGDSNRATLPAQKKEGGLF